MKKILAIVLLGLVPFLFCSNKLLAQLSFGGEPDSFEYKDLSVDFQTINIQPPDMEVLAEEDLENDEFSYPRRFAKLIPVSYNLENSGTWEKLPNGAEVWRLRLCSEDALAISLYFSDFYLPKGSELYLYDDEKIQLKGAYTHENNHSSKLFATELLIGEAITIELYVPYDVIGKPSLQISEFGYAYRFVPQYDSSKGFGSSDFCEINTVCSPEGDEWQDEKKGVVRIQVRVSGSGFWCSGSLVNNAKQDLTPYVLTADHCAFQFAHYATPDDLNQWLFYFDYESATCSNPQYEPELKSLVGATKIAQGGNRGSTGSDFYLVLLNNSSIPSSYNPYFNGWNIIDIASTSGVTIHHPEGDIRKISTYTTPLVSYDFMTNGLMAHWKVFWAETPNNWAVTEPGSSGSPIFDGEGRIVGTLTGGYAACESTGPWGPDKPDFYGKFSWHWQSNGNADTAQLKPWLDPENTGITVLDGKPVGVVTQPALKEQSVEIYPNPAENLININFINFEPVEIQLLLFDILGKPVKVFNFYMTSNHQVLDISDIPSGVYFARIDDKEKIVIQRLVKK